MLISRLPCVTLCCAGNPAAAPAVAVHAAATKFVAHRPLHVSCTFSNYFKPISYAAYWDQVDLAAQSDPLDLRTVVALPAADIVTSSDDAAYVSASSSISPKRRRNGYEIDGFVVDSADSDESQ
jgi:hypothetical protein